MLKCNFTELKSKPRNPQSIHHLNSLCQHNVFFITANPVSITSTPPGNKTLQNGPDPPHVLILLLVAVTIVMVVLVLVVVGFLHLRKYRGTGKELSYCVFVNNCQRNSQRSLNR